MVRVLCTVILAMLKLQEIEGFATMFLNYELVARRWVPYSYFYPFAELRAGVLMEDEEGDAGLEATEMILVPPGAKDEIGHSGLVQCYDGDER